MIIVLLGIIAYTFVVQPAISGYVIDKQLEARDIVLGNMLAQIQQQGYVQITDAQGNVITLAPVDSRQ